MAWPRGCAAIVPARRRFTNAYSRPEAVIPKTMISLAALRNLSTRLSLPDRDAQVWLGRRCPRGRAARRL
jgi:hypothetical protein